MFPRKKSILDSSDRSAASQPMLDADTSGIISGTKVATDKGWVCIETLCEGQNVLTFDNGMQTVIAITKRSLLADDTFAAGWPMTVPADALGNREDMAILPHQPVMIESDLSEALTGDPFTVIPSLALTGFRGISQVRPKEPVEVIQLHFAQDEIVFANIGALFLCNAKADLKSDRFGMVYEVQPMEQATDLVECMTLEDTCRTQTDFAEKVAVA